MQCDGTHHNALDDAAAQALHLMECLAISCRGEALEVREAAGSNSSTALSDLRANRHLRLHTGT